MLPIGKRMDVGMINWGFVNGKTQTDMPWDSWQLPYVLRPPVVWFHDLLPSGRHALSGARDRDHQGAQRRARKGLRRPWSDHFQGVTGGTSSVAAGADTEPKSAGETISRYSMSGE